MKPSRRPSPSSTRITASWARSTAADERLAGSAVLQHAGQALVHDVADAADEHGDEGLELLRHPIGDEVLEGDGVHQLVGEVTWRAPRSPPG